MMEARRIRSLILILLFSSLVVMTAASGAMTQANAPAAISDSGDETWYPVEDGYSTTNREAHAQFRQCRRTRFQEPAKWLPCYRDILVRFANEKLRDWSGYQWTYGHLAKRNIELGECRLSMGEEAPVADPAKLLETIHLAAKKQEIAIILPVTGCGSTIKRLDAPEYRAVLSSERYLSGFFAVAKSVDWEKTAAADNKPEKVDGLYYAPKVPLYHIPVYDRGGQCPFWLTVYQKEEGWLWSGILLKDHELLSNWDIEEVDLHPY